MVGGSQLPIIPAPAYKHKVLLAALGQGALDVTEQEPRALPLQWIIIGKSVEG